MIKIKRFFLIGIAVATVGLAGPVPSAVLRAQGGCTRAVVMSPGGNAAALSDTSLSGDGRYMAFASGSSDLVSNDTNGAADAFLLDRATCTVERISVTSGAAQANNFSLSPSISLDGRFVAFISAATNLGPTPDTNGVPDVFVRDRVNGTTLLVSSALNGGWSNGTAELGGLAISGNGRFVAFWSGATDLVSSDTNGGPDVFVRDTVAGSTTRVSVATGGVQSSNGIDVMTEWVGPAISEDGRYVSFISLRSDLVPGDTNGAFDVFRHDRQTGVTVRVSVSSAGVQLDAHSFRPAMSRDGNQVAFDTNAAAVPGDTNGSFDVFVRDVVSGTTTRVSLVSQGGEVNGNSIGPSISGDGRYVAFLSAGTNLGTGGNDGLSDVYVHDRVTGITRRVSESAPGISGNGASEAPHLSDDGAFLSFASEATNLGPVDQNGGNKDAFVMYWRSVNVQPGANLLRNGDFAAGFDFWLQFALPAPENIVLNATGGVLQFSRAPGSTQAVVLQGTNAQLPAFAPITASFHAANSTGGRKRISVLIHDGDFTDLSVCTFWLDAAAPMRTYGMQTHTTQPWANATLSIYAATDDGTPYQVDDVSLAYTPGAPDERTDCTDPTAVVSAGSPGPNLVVNGDFSAGSAGWTTFGQIVGQVAGGVFEFYRPAGTPAGVVLQSTGQTMTDDTILTATFKLGNSSSVRRRVTVLLHDLDFSDLSACTFWLPPGLPLSNYTMRSFTTKPWTNATVSFYGATISTAPWFRLDDVEVRRTPGSVPIGTSCVEPGLSTFVTVMETESLTVQGAAATVQSSTGAVVQGAQSAMTTAPAQRTVSPRTVEELPASNQARFPLQFWLAPHDEALDVQVSADGDTWVTVASFDASEDWVFVELDAIGGLQVRLKPRL